MRCGQILFSEGTYQVEVLDPKEDEAFWPFLQMDDRGEVLDHFCTCNGAENGKTCRHQKEALKAIFRGKGEPLHVRFRDSLWNELATMAALRHGFDLKMPRKEGTIALFSQTKKKLFEMRPKTAAGKRRLQEILFERVEETEETSLKFSRLPLEEIQLWREGRPSSELQYELSFWSDLAKWWMALQEEGKPCKITFSEEGDALPSWIQIDFADVKVGFYIAEVNWERVIPSLLHVDSPLPVYDVPGGVIEKIEYDKGEKRLKIESHKKEGVVLEKKGIVVGEWTYVPKVGFYPARFDPLLLEKEIPLEKIGSLLHTHPKLFEKHLKKEVIHRGEHRFRYNLWLEKERGLVIEPYLLEVGDLSKGTSAAFDSWVYIDKKGFFHVEKPLFEGLQKVIPLDKLSDFVSKHRNWLAEFPGFELHLAAIEAHPSYKVRGDGTLTFHPHFELLEEEEEAVDIGEWIFIRGKGFYPKMNRYLERFFKEGSEIASEEVCRFIHRYRDELEHVKGFFFADNPLEKAGLVIALSEEGRVVVTPHYTYKTGYDPRRTRFYEDFIYVEGKGFSWVPAEMLLPPQYNQEQVISAGDLHQFLSFELKTLEKHILSIDPRLKEPKMFFLRLSEIKRDPKTKVPTWIAALTYESDVGEVSVYELFQAIQQKKKFLFSDAGLIFFPQMRFSWLKRLGKKKFLEKGKRVRLTTLEWIQLSVHEEVQEPLGDALQARRSRKLLESFRTFETKEPFNVEGLLSKLRPYQETGAQWLWFLYCNGLSGLLCDDMGLGKTHQAMALLSAAFNQGKGKYLVVCPTSVLYHWEDLLKRFLPSLRVSVFHGILRKKPQEFDLILTSYGIVRTEKQYLSSIGFDVAIFDELQAAKNPKSQTHKMLKTLNAKMRVGLTGTPIENQLLELKALFDIVVPTYLPQEASFRQLFVNPIEKHQDPDRIRLLRKLIAPFILRRKKQEVLLELPEKIEEIAYCPLSDEQKTLYNQVVEEHKASLLKALENPNEPVPYLHIFSLLSTLKQICDHPALYHKNVSEAPHHHSGKWELFVELLQETLDSGQKLVVFSQYLGMLDIIEAHLRSLKIKFAGIRGSTRDRKGEMDRFRDDPKCAVFVASLKAAGVGVDLVAASVVIHYDRWWNPAKENQATDRVHRIGQSRGVQVFKMVTKHTIEEHIHSLIEKKVGLAEQAIAYDDQNQLKSLDRQELMHLLRLIDLS